jgi:hypothetical protein
VIATGGGTMLDRDTERLLGGSGRVYCLAASPEAILDRVLHSRSGKTRPLLEEADPAARVQRLLSDRMARYRRFPQVSTDEGGSDTVADQLEMLVRTPLTVHDGGGRAVVIGIGIAARAAALLAGTEATIVDVGRIQPARRLDARALVAIQHALSSYLDTP